MAPLIIRSIKYPSSCVESSIPRRMKTMKKVKRVSQSSQRSNYPKLSIKEISTIVVSSSGSQRAYLRKVRRLLKMLMVHLCDRSKVPAAPKAADSLTRPLHTHMAVVYHHCDLPRVDKHQSNKIDRSPF